MLGENDLGDRSPHGWANAPMEGPYGPPGFDVAIQGLIAKNPIHGPGLKTYLACIPTGNWSSNTWPGFLRATWFISCQPFGVQQTCWNLHGFKRPSECLHTYSLFVRLCLRVGTQLNTLGCSVGTLLCSVSLLWSVFSWHMKFKSVLHFISYYSL